MTYFLFAAAGALSAWLMVWLLNKMPARCFCDYDESPT